jgi:hypothetical protein
METFLQRIFEIGQCQLMVINILKLPLEGHLQLYADDAILIYSDHDFQRMQRNMREDLNLIYDWFYANLLSFNIRKTKYIIFYQKNKNIPNPDPLIVRNAEIERVTKTKYLGLILDEKLSWNEHIEYIKTKIRPFISMLRRTSYLLPSTTRLSVYHSHIHCHLSYLISVWGYTGSTRLEELTRFQNKAIRLIYWQEYRQGLSTDDLYKKYNILKLPLLMKFESMMSIYKLKSGLLRSNLIFPLSSDVHTYLTRNRSNMYLPNPRTNYLKRSIFFEGIVSFNALPNEIKILPNLIIFKKMLKSHLQPSQE